MKIERQVEQGLLIGQRLGKTRPESLHLHGPARRMALSDTEGEESAEEAVFEDENGNGSGTRGLLSNGKRHGRRMSQASVMEELKRQSGVFFDDSDEADGESEETEEEEEGAPVVENGATRVE